jgi:hypothetical protein
LLVLFSVTIHTAGSPPGALALMRSRPATTSIRNCQPSSSPMTTMLRDAPTPLAVDLPTPGTPRVVTVRPLAAERRTPVVIVHVVVGPLVLVLGVVRLQVRPPVADGGGPAIGASSEVWASIEQAVLAAVQADPAARAHLFGLRQRLARH